ncbi:hypothetical protein SISSUDRAFT_1066253 [Sistotremastrum suecicum HHB10207 ss-3]|uniref:Uncharacterized protein n=1 Tax=Sistotremastrum suecicum HHB10207 ss-3 TaxID=1314776 RepID=A0A165YIU1_9AGAM|nr:hypothetical protein SISSUDRAFT_1066253 [Sistotremastrum suecicum HHB10207 ss-3]
MPPGRLHPQPIEDGVRRFAAIPDVLLAKKASPQLRPESADEADSDRRSTPSLRARSEIVQVGCLTPSRQDDTEAPTAHPSSTTPRSRSEECGDDERITQRIFPQRTSEPIEPKSPSTEIKPPTQTIHLEVVREIPARSPTERSKIKCIMVQTADQVILQLDESQARILSHTLNSLFHFHHPNEASVARSHDRASAIPPDITHFLQDPDHPDRTPPVRSARTVRGFHWTLWRETASPGIHDDVRNNSVIPLVKIESSSAGDLYELRYGPDRPQMWVRNLEPSVWTLVPSALSPPVYHPENDEYVLYMKDDASSPSWVKRETRKKYARQLEKLNRMPGNPSV